MSNNESPLVGCVIIPTEIFWRLTIQWLGGNVMCKVAEFLRAFGLYLSSLIVICVSVDRYLAIMFPLNTLKVGSYRKIKVMIATAWTAAALFSAPQAIYFGVESHPDFPSFKQCVTSSFVNNSRHMKIYSVFSVAAMYFVPLFIIIVTYTFILIKLSRKSKESDVSSRNIESDPASAEHSNDSELQKPSAVSDIQLRRSKHGNVTMSRAKNRTLLITVVIVLAFVVCWTPYGFMTLWYMFDWEGAEKVDPRLQDALFLMVVANSCINPLIYGGFHYSRGMTRILVCCNK